MYLVNKEKVNRSLSSGIVDARVARVFNSFKEVLVTSSFGTTSAVLLHLVSRIKPDCPIYFIDTGYHFKETLLYRDRMARLLGLNLKIVHPNSAPHKMTQKQQLWSRDADRCCSINKVKPLQAVKKQYNVWMSGLIGFQNQLRNTLQIMDDGEEMLKFYPLIDWNSALVEEYIENHSLPQHPLKAKGYDSVGCTHCTLPGMGREGRWNALAKTECGLHR